MLNRRYFIAATLCASAAGAAKKRLKILLRSAWQTVNIGDIAHTPGVLALLEKHLPQVDVTLWPSKVDNGVEAMLRARFPQVKLAKTKDEVAAAIRESDFLLHGSGPSLVAKNDVARWVKESGGKPYGVYGITVSRQDSTATVPMQSSHLQGAVDLLSGARFVFFRDSVSLELVKSLGCTCPVMEFGPDGAFAVDLADDAKATAFLKAHDLESGQFLCCIPRLRYTPYWLLPEKQTQIDPIRQARNDGMKEHDMQPLRDAINAVVRQTKLKVLLCPEDKTQMQIGKELIYDRLPEDVKERVVWREHYWLTDEALSTYRQSAGLFGHEMHSPIMCIGHGIPAIVCRWAEQTSKGLMWRDIGLSEWLFDLDDEAQLAKVGPAVLAIAKDPQAARQLAARGRSYVEQRQRETMQHLRRELGP
jgi:polysaccharide pyruvyl transferase WcaK-like protein